jgi:cell division transport system permease protein
MLISFKRVFKNGWISFKRNIGLNIATIFVMILVIFLINILFFLNIIFSILISEIRNKADISVYFKKDVSFEKISEIQSEISKLPETKSVEYVSKEAARESFIERYKNNPVLIDSLNEIGENPFLSSLKIKAKEAEDYGKIVDFVKKLDFGDLIEEVDYFQRKPVIDKIFSITSGVNKAGILFAVVFSFIAVLAGFNAIKIAIQNLREEIETMRLVGASNWFIRGPFLVQGVIVGFFSILITFFITSIICFIFDSKLKTLISGISFVDIFINNLWKLILIQFITGIGLSVFSSILAIRKYLKI